MATLIGGHISEYENKHNNDFKIYADRRERDNDYYVGVTTTAERKAGFVQILIKYLTNKQINTIQYLVTSTPNILTTLLKQMKNYKRIVRTPKNTFQKTRITYSGKNFGADDLAVTLQLAVYWACAYSTSHYL